MDGRGINSMNRITLFNVVLDWAEQMLCGDEDPHDVFEVNLDLPDTLHVDADDIDLIVKSLNTLLRPRAVFNHSGGCIFAVYLHVIPATKK